MVINLANVIVYKNCYYRIMNDFDFYNVINKPVYAPDRNVFKTVWTVLYILMFVSFIIFYFKPLSIVKILATPLFCLQLLLNLSWSPVFFRYKKIGMAFGICVLLLITVILMTLLFFRMSFLLGILQIPYIVWLIIAVRLNYDIMKMN